MLRRLAIRTVELQWLTNNHGGPCNMGRLCRPIAHQIHPSKCTVNIRTGARSAGLASRQIELRVEGAPYVLGLPKTKLLPVEQKIADRNAAFLQRCDHEFCLFRWDDAILRSLEEREASRGRRLRDLRRRRLVAGAAAIGETRRGGPERRDERRRPRRSAGDDQAAENRPDRHAGRGRPMQPRKDRPAEARSIRAASAFIVTSTAPPTSPDPIRITPTVSAVSAFRSAQRAAPNSIAVMPRTLLRRSDAQARWRPTSPRDTRPIASENPSEGGGIDTGARKNRARCAAPKADADSERLKHPCDRRKYARRIGRQDLRPFEKAVGKACADALGGAGSYGGFPRLHAHLHLVSPTAT